VSFVEPGKENEVTETAPSKISITILVIVRQKDTRGRLNMLANGKSSSNMAGAPAAKGSRQAHPKTSPSPSSQKKLQKPLNILKSTAIYS
jgi:hypothetical protein